VAGASPVAHYSRHIEALARIKIDLILGPKYPVRVNKRLTEDQAQTIIDRVAEGEQQKILAAEFKVTAGTVSNLVKGKSWPDLDRPDPPEVTLRGCKLSSTDIPVIRVRLANLEKPAAVATDYGVTRQTIANIGLGKTWRHIPLPEPEKPRRKRVWED
jgi:hypothetical protein